MDMHLSASGGGGGGGVVISSGFDCGFGSHPITVGNGGTGQTGNGGTIGPGSDSVFAMLVLEAETVTLQRWWWWRRTTRRSGDGGDGGSGGGSSGTTTQPTQNPGVTHITNYGNPHLVMVVVVHFVHIGSPNVWWCWSTCSWI